jgi:hypothetical protein
VATGKEITLQISMEQGKMENLSLAIKMLQIKTEFKNLEVTINDGETIRREENHTGATVRIPTSCSGCLVTDKNEPIKVTIKWNTRKEETFLLKAR